MDSLVEPRILVVANPIEAERIARWLEDSSMPSPRVGDGSDETLAELGRDPADVLVLTATLDHGDALSFAAAIRSEAASTAWLVLIGDERGPVRTA
jgi:hypothetical protein